MTYLKVSDRTLFTDTSFQKFHKYPSHGILALTFFRFKMMKNSIIFLKRACKMQTLNTLSSFKNFKMNFNDSLKPVQEITFLSIPKTGNSSIRIKSNQRETSNSKC